MSFNYFLSAELLVKPIVFLGGLCLGYFMGVIIRRSSKSDVIGNSVQEQEIEVSKQPTHTVALIVNLSLKMGKGKIAAQCGHAILSLCKRARKNSKGIVELWFEEGRDIKIVSVKSTDDFDFLEQMAEMESLDHYLVADAGRTQIKGGSLTVMGIGPGTVDSINRVIGQLPIYS